MLHFESFAHNSEGNWAFYTSEVSRLELKNLQQKKKGNDETYLETNNIQIYFFDFSDEKTDINESMPPAARHTRCGWKVRQETAPIL